MKSIEIIEQTATYTLFQADYKDTKQVFRKWIASKIIEIQFTDDFCRANGFKNRADMLRKEPKLRQQLDIFCGGIPEWVQVVNGEFCVKMQYNAN